MYSLFGAPVSDEQAIRAALESAGVKGLIVMQPLYVDRDVRVTPAYEGQTSASSLGRQLRLRIRPVLLIAQRSHGQRNDRRLRRNAGVRSMMW